MNLKSFPDRRPYAATALLFIAAIIVFLAAGTIVAIMRLAPWSLYIIAFTLLAVICITLISIKGWWREAGFRTPYERHLLWLFWLPFVPVIGNLIEGIPDTDLAQVLLFFVLALLSGFVEETLFRGLMLRVLRPTGVWRASIISALLFGVMHILNVLSFSNPTAALLQVGYASAIGFCYAALVIRTGTIWPLILAHFLTNFAGFMAASGTGAAGPVAFREMMFTAVYIVVLSAYGVYLLRSNQRGIAVSV
ncbi:MAG: CPBP family intramembrane metalloprotease [Chloroflexi bacterium]|nr:CPBP family intramembrane metalloprotease [Chloroflexota bacterium]